MIIKTKDYTPVFITEHKENGITIFNDLVKLDRSNLICIAARPGMGKTSLALHMALEYAKKCDKTIYIFTLEMSAKKIYQRMICYLSEIDSHELDNNSLSNEQKEAVEQAEEYLKTLNIVIDDEPMLSVEKIEERLEKENNLGLVIIDYLELLTVNGKFDNRVQELSLISRNLHILMKRKNVPLIFIKQLLRKIEWREDKRPRLIDIRDFGCIEQDSDTVIFIYRNEYYHDISKDCSQAEIIIAKNRYDCVDTVFLKWQGRYGKFSESYKVNKKTKKY